MNWLEQPFFQISLPIVAGQATLIVVLIFGFLNQNKRLDDILKRLESIEHWMMKAESRLTALETRAGLLYSK